MTPIKQTTIPIKGYTIILKTYADGQTAIESNLMDDIEDDQDFELSAAYDTIESLILAQYSVGIKVGSPAYAEALQTTLDAIANNIS